MINRGCVILLSLTAAAYAGSAPNFHVIANLNYLPGGLLEGAPGVFYSEGNIPGSTVSLAFSVNTQGTTTTLASFQGNGLNMVSQLVSAENGRFYSTVEQNVFPAQVFSVSAQASSQQVYASQNIVPGFSEGLPDGLLLGGAGWSGIDYIIRSTLDGIVTTVYQFPPNQVLPSATIYATDGNYYGVEEDTQDSAGYIYRVTPSGTATVVSNLPSGTFRGGSSLPFLQASDGNFYGATIAGGAEGFGSVYQVTAAGQYTLLHSFPKGKAAGGPTTLIEATDGNLYGAAQNGEGFGYIFRLTRSGQYAELYVLNGSDGICPCWLLQGSDGLIYGVAKVGGSVGAGTFFSLDAGLTKPRPWARYFSPESGAPGTRVRIWGLNLLSATVSFNGLPGVSVTNSGPNYVWATVPAGATTGPLSVTTPGGTDTTQASFTVQ